MFDGSLLWHNPAPPCILDDYYTGYRAFSRKVLNELPLLENSDRFCL
jgi:hypothetical protein